MSKHTALVRWSRDGGSFAEGRYSRAHTWSFDGGAVVAASASPQVVGRASSDPAGVDPEEAFVAAVSSCHMLTFLHLASKEGLVVERYEDEAVGELGKDADGKLAIVRVRLGPKIEWGGAEPDEATIARLHHDAHEECFIARSIKTEVIV